MRKKVILTTCLMTIYLMLFLWGLSWVLSPHPDFLVSYTGNLVFNTEAEYTDFKEALIESRAQWDGTEVLSSSPPIIVKLVAKVSNGIDFPYGEPNQESPNFTIFLLAFGLIIASGFTSLFIWEEEKSME